MLSLLRRRPAARCALSLSVTSTACSASSLYLFSLTGMLCCGAATTSSSGGTVAEVAAAAPHLTTWQCHRTAAAATFTSPLDSYQSC